MRRGPKPAKSKQAKPPVTRKSPQGDGARVRELEKRLEEALQREAEALRQLQTSHRELVEAQEQQAATAEILRVISSSPTNIQFVFDTILRTAARLCDAFDANLLLADGDEFVQRAHHGPIGALVQDARYPLRGTVSGRAMSEVRIIQVDDLAAATEYPIGSELARKIGYRTTLIVPLVRDGLALGAIGILRTEVRPFTDTQITLIKTFADQAVIAIENVRLFKELQTSNRELTTALDQQTATSDILRVISRSQTDVQPVFDAIVASAVRLLRGHTSTLARIADGQIALVALTTSDPGADAALRARYPQPLDSAEGYGQTIRGRAPLNIGDAQTDPRLPEAQRASARLRGFRSLAVVPLLRQGEAIGAIGVSRREPGGFTDDEIALLQTFADQAVIAIENVRLFNETTEALDRQTATSEILRVISSSPTDVQPVFDAIAENALRLCEATFSAVFRYDGELIHLAALRDVTPEGAAAIRDMYPMPPGRGGAAARSILSRSIAHVADVLHDPEYAYRGVAEAAEFRSILSVPMLRDGQPIGAITVAGPIARPFPAKQVELLRLFADQAVIAIENVRLFKELEASNREIAEKSRQIEVASHHKSEFLANMSHELRTPLNAIIGFSEVLAEKMFGELNEKQEEYSKDIHASGQHLLSLINDILDLSKIEAGRMELELSDFHLPTALDSALTLVRERAGRRGIALNLAVDDRLAQIQADERKVRQVVLNLLSNAIKFTPEGGRIEVAAMPKDGFVEVSVRDTGVGIAPADQEAVFEEFRQVGTADKKAEGTGLGLTLCRKFVELHGGKIWVKSEVGAGSTFTFSIRVRPRESVTLSTP